MTLGKMKSDLPNRKRKLCSRLIESVYGASHSSVTLCISTMRLLFKLMSNQTLLILFRPNAHLLQNMFALMFIYMYVGRYILLWDSMPEQHYN